MDILVFCVEEGHASADAVLVMKADYKEIIEQYRSPLSIK